MGEEEEEEDRGNISQRGWTNGRREKEVIDESKLVKKEKGVKTERKKKKKGGEADTAKSKRDSTKAKKKRKKVKSGHCLMSIICSVQVVNHLYTLRANNYI